MNTSRQVDVKALVSHILRGDGTDKCRICMGDTTEGQVYLGDTVMLDGERPVTLAELLETITGVEMESSTSLPNRLCINCVSKLLDIIPFIQLCRESDRKWKHLIDLLNIPSTVKHSVHVLISNDCEKREMLNCSKMKIKDTKEALRLLQQRIKRKKQYNRSSEKDKRLKKKIANNVNMSCPECDQRFGTIFTLNKHLKNLKKKMCTYCYIMMDLKAFKSHAKTHNLHVYSCDVCHICFKRKKYLLMHKLKHSRGKHVCVECKSSFSSLSKLTLHISRHKRCVCSTCYTKFSNKNCFLNHAKVCAQSKDLDASKFICDYCSIEYNNKTALKAHIKLRHVEGGNFQCDKCGKTFANKVHLEEHGNTHEKVFNRFVCKCGLNYSTRRGYQRHLKKHLTGDIDKPCVPKVNAEFRCYLCKNTFSNRKDFKKHIQGNHCNFELELVDEPAMEIEVITIKRG